MEMQELQGGTFSSNAQAVAGLNKPFWARITDYDGTKFYSWVQVEWIYEGATDMEGGMAETFATGPARDPNGCFVPVGTVVLLQRASLDENLGWFYIIIAAGAANVCDNSLSGSGSGSGGGGGYWWCVEVLDTDCGDPPADCGVCGPCTDMPCVLKATPGNAVGDLSCAECAAYTWPIRMIQSGSESELRCVYTSNGAGNSGPGGDAPNICAQVVTLAFTYNVSAHLWSFEVTNGISTALYQATAVSPCEWPLTVGLVSTLFPQCDWPSSFLIEETA